MPIILIGISITLFLVFTNPLYKDISLLREKVSAYNGALNNSKILEQERDKLTQKYNAIGSENLDKLQKLLPETVDNIRLILEIEKLALPYNMVLKDVKYDSAVKESNNTNTTIPGVIFGGVGPKSLVKDYGIWNLEFSTEGTYNNFINFTKDLENNLRIVDISSVSFSSSSSASAASNIYKYSFKIKTYWLKK